VSSRTYLSIGDVLTLLRQEFPDVTISKIRFLESQGLVNPERTPSGYRKFYEHDVERLRWVLRQQREHFLPLKVIKGRLEQEVADGGDDNGHDGGVAPGSPERHEPVLVGRTSATGAPRAGGSELPGFEPPRVEPSRRADAARARAAHAETTPPPRRGGTVAAPAPATAGTPAGAVSRGAGAGTSGGLATRTLASEAGGSALSAASRPGAAHGGAGAAGAAGAAGSAATKAGPGPGPVLAKGSASTAGSRAGAGPRLGAFGLAAAEPEASGHAGRAEPAVRTLSGASLTVEEVAEGSGLDVADVEELESYGLLCGRVVGGVAYYDEDSLTVARVAAGLARYGVEARHLRLHKHAAEREAGFIEQIVLPLLKQRNPEARQRAHEAVAELTLLGQGLREVLLRSTLRDQLGG
jgi:DNA-binding transcriptional MerR regulator